MRFATKPLIILAALIISSCATPDIKPWAENTAKLSVAVSTEHSAVLTRMVGAKASIEAWNASDRRVTEVGEVIEIYQTNASKIEAILDLAVDYSNALTELAAAGESGEAAAEQIIGSFQRFKDAANVTFPGAGAATDIIGKVFGSVSDAITRIQSQKSLEAAMQIAEVGPVPVIAEQITEMFRKANPEKSVRAGAQRQIIVGFQGVEDGIALDIAGFNRTAFYKGVNVTKIELNGIPATRLDHYFAELGNQIRQQNALKGICSPNPEPNNGAVGCLTGETAEGLAAIVNLVIATEANYQQFANARSENAAFARQRTTAADKIAGAVKAWRNEHTRIYEMLKQCGGWKALRGSCGNLTFANFEAAVEKLKDIAGTGDD